MEWNENIIIISANYKTVAFSGVVISLYNVNYKFQTGIT